jgi:hypothetical protein
MTKVEEFQALIPVGESSRVPTTLVFIAFWIQFDKEQDPNFGAYMVAMLINIVEGDITFNPFN